MWNLSVPRPVVRSTSCEIAPKIGGQSNSTFRIAVTNNILPEEFVAIENYINKNSLPPYSAGRGSWLSGRPGLQTSGFSVIVIFGSKDSIFSRVTPRRAHQWVSPGAASEPPYGHCCLGGMYGDPFPTFVVSCANPLGNAQAYSSLVVISMRFDGVPR